jgi:hypothetical protein
VRIFKIGHDDSFSLFPVPPLDGQVFRPPRSDPLSDCRNSKGGGKTIWSLTTREHSVVLVEYIVFCGILLNPDRLKGV